MASLKKHPFTEHKAEPSRGLLNIKWQVYQSRSFHLQETSEK